MKLGSSFSFNSIIAFQETIQRQTIIFGFIISICFIKKVEQFLISIFDGFLSVESHIFLQGKHLVTEVW
jgi:hypothetical protein